MTYVGKKCFLFESKEEIRKSQILEAKLINFWKKSLLPRVSRERKTFKKLGCDERQTFVTGLVKVVLSFTER